MGNYTIGIDVGGTKIAYGLFNPARELVARRREPSNPALDGGGFFDGIAEGIQNLLSDTGLTLADLDGVGVGMPSFVLFEEGRLLTTTNLTRILDFPARDVLSEKLGGKRVILDNDGHIGALAESRRGAGRGCDNLLFCPVSTGISSGIIIGGKLFRGDYGWSGESGHMLVTPGEGVLCGCGNQGCLMSYCSGSMIVRHIRKWIEAGETTLMTELAGRPENINVTHLSAALDAGDPMAERAFAQMTHYLGVWLFNLYVTLNIRLFVFGGGMTQMGDKLFGRVRTAFDSFDHVGVPVEFKMAELGADAGIIGAHELLFEEGKQ